MMKKILTVNSIVHTLCLGVVFIIPKKKLSSLALKFSQYSCTQLTCFYVTMFEILKSDDALDIKMTPQAPKFALIY